MIQLRPHHLLCYAFYEGKGYDTQFIENMDRIYKRLNEDSVVLIAECDDLCCVCPHQSEKKRCITQEKVIQLDKNVLSYFNLEIGKQYIYSSVKKRIIEKLDAHSFKQICGTCQWYQSTCTLEKLNKRL